MRDKTDEEIAAKVQSGDLESFSFLVERYEKKLKRYARKFLANPEDINDIAQEIFIKAYVNIKSFDIEKKFSPWIYRIAHNELVNLLKKKEKNPLLFFDADTLFPHPVSREETDRKTQSDEIKKLLDKCLNQIPSKYREPLLLFYMEELSYNEIAEVMRVPISTVGVRLKRGKRMLKNICDKLNLNYGNEEIV
jgi:RNA polymerase sigma-70 factor (ECF subfamily)